MAKSAPTDDELDAMLDSARESGELSGLQQAERLLRGEAGRLFGDGKDDKARLLRSLADNLKKKIDPLEEKAKARSEAALAAARARTRS